MGEDDPKPTNSEDQNDEQVEDEPLPGPGDELLPGVGDDVGTVGAEPDQAGESSDGDPVESPYSSGWDPRTLRHREEAGYEERLGSDRRADSPTSDSDDPFDSDDWLGPTWIDQMREVWEEEQRASRRKEREERRARVARGDKKYSEARVEAERRGRFIRHGFFAPVSGAVILGLAAAGLFVVLSGGGDSTEDAANNGSNVPAAADQTQEQSTRRRRTWGVTRHRAPMRQAMTPPIACQPVMGSQRQTMVTGTRPDR